MSYNIAVVGATGAVGREVLNALAERQFPYSNVYALASQDSKGKQVSFGEETTLTAEPLDTFDFSKADLTFFCTSNGISKEYAPRAAQAGCIVIDKSSHFRNEENVPLIVPEVNAEALKNFRETNIIANPNCTTIPRALALKPLLNLSPIKRVVASTYQSVSGAGREGMDELYSQTRNILMNAAAKPKAFQKQIAFNVIPIIDDMMDDGSTKEEFKNVVETQKILETDIPLTATCVRVPVFVGHSESLNVEFENTVHENELWQALEDAPGVIILDGRNEESYATPIECVGEDMIFISRIRRDHSVTNGFNMWLVSDNLRKGAATNAVQIAETLIENYF